MALGFEGRSGPPDGIRSGRQRDDIEIGGCAGTDLTCECAKTPYSAPHRPAWTPSGGIPRLQTENRKRVEPPDLDTVPPANVAGSRIG
jgi:hypothetical protein